MKLMLQRLQEMAATRGVPLPAEEESLFKAGVMDSLGLLELILVLEEELQISIPDDDVKPGRFESVARIREYVESRRTT
jgi:acyl carrier protein